MLRRLICFFSAALFLVSSVSAGEHVVARMTGAATFEDDGGDVILTVPLDAAIPWKVWLASDPPRLIIDFNDLEFNEPVAGTSSSVSEVSFERHSPNWSRMITLLREPLLVDRAEMLTDDGSATLQLVLAPATPIEFAEAAKGLPVVAPTEANKKPVIVIDPGHGGRDPGAEAGEFQRSQLDVRVCGAVAHRSGSNRNVRRGFDT